MPAPPSIEIAVRIGDGEYGQLIVEAIKANTPGPTRVSVAGGPLVPPPTQNVLLGSDSQAAEGDLAQRGPNVMSQPWVKWMDRLWRFLRDLGFLLDPAAGPMIQLTAWSIREIDVEWWAEIPAALYHDQTTFTPTLHGYSRYGRAVGYLTITGGGGGYSQAGTTLEFNGSGVGAGAQFVPIISAGGSLTGATQQKGGWYPFAPTVTVRGAGTLASAVANLYAWAPGQYFLINDENPSGAIFKYEICRIVSINYTTGVWTIERGLLGTEAVDHGTSLEGTNLRCYLLIPGKFSWIMGPEPPPQDKKFLWDNMCVAVVQAQIIGQAPITMNLLPSFATQPPRPGVRSMGGAAYINLRAFGVVGVDSNTDKADAAQCWETIRYVYAKTDDDGEDPEVIVCWINGTDVRLVGIVTANTGESTVGVQMPLGSRWPPNMLSACLGALDGLNNLVSTMTFDDSDKAQFSMDGYFRAVVRSGTGTNLRVVVQT